MRLVKFGSYVFQDTGVRIGTNFADLVPITSRIPGVDGGFDEYGDVAAPSEIGSISFEMVLSEDRRAEMQRKVDVLRGLARLGVQRLAVDTWDDGLNYRYCWARVNNVQVSDNVTAVSHRVNRVQITFQVSSPRWQEISENDALYGEAVFGVDVFGGGIGVIHAVSGTSTTFTLDNDGNADAYPEIFYTTGAAQAVTSPITIARLVNGVVIDQLTIATALTAEQTLYINTQTKTITKQQVNAYSSLTPLTPQWLRLLPGSNSMRVTMGGGGNAASVRFKFAATWY